MKWVIYPHKTAFKGGLFIFALIMIMLMFFYIKNMVSDLRKDSREILEMYANIYAKIGSEELSEFSFLFDEIIQKTNFPLIVTDNNKEPDTWQGINIPTSNRSEESINKVRSLIRKMDKESNPIPVMYGDIVLQYLHYGDSQLIKSLGMLPYVQILGVGLFIMIGFIGFNNIRRSEQRFIWVGMAKETAHQLGTPISSLMGWVEILENSADDKERYKNTIIEIENDVKRLDKIANRFSFIGSPTELKKGDITESVREVISYIRRRLPQVGKDVQIIEKFEEIPHLHVNKGLFEWVVENLLKNSLDAINREKGRIIIYLSNDKEKKGRVFIDVKDNGKGIHKKHWKEIFKPGYSTKKRGWGLGLSLAKRIIEDYHKGALFVKESKLGEGTTIRVVLSAK